MTVQRRSVPPRTVYLAAALAVCLLLCLSLTFCLMTSPRPPQLALSTVEATDADAQSGEDKVMSVVDAPLGPFSLELTEAEVTSLLALRLPGSPFMRPQVHLTNGHVFISGEVSMGASLMVKSLWSIGGDVGHPLIRLERASIGPVALPEALLGSVSSTINQMIAESGTGIMPTAVVVGNGTVRVDGTKSPPTVQ